MRFLPGLFVTAFLVVSSLLAADTPPSIVVFTPQGIVKGVTQVRAGFSEEMVPFGEPMQAEPFRVDCKPKGKGRWIDTKNWVYDFAEAPLPAGVSCKFELKTDTKTLKGKAVTGKKSFSFTTGGPAVTGISPYSGSQTIVEDQVFVVTADAPIKTGSIESGVHFEIGGIKEKVGARVVGGSDRTRILRVQRMKDEPHIVLLQAKQRFPNNAPVYLIWGKGVLSESGVANTTVQQYEYKVRDEFRLTFSCERENPKAACTPFSSFSLSFTSNVSRKQALDISVKSAKGQTWKPSGGSDDSPTLSYLSFPGPLPDRETFTISIPKGMKDEEGRLLVNADRFPLVVKTASYPPLAKFPSTFGIIEAKGGAMLPVTVRNLEKTFSSKLLKVNVSGEVKGKSLRVGAGNLEQIVGWMKRIGQMEREDSVFKATQPSSVNELGEDGYRPPPYEPLPAGKASEFELPRKFGEKEFEVVGIPLPEPGFYVVELDSASLGAALTGKKKSVYVSTAVLVTDLSVHFKYGQESSLAWVTRLSDGKPVAGASVNVLDCGGKSLFAGKSDKDGLVKIAGLPSEENVLKCKSERYSPWTGGLTVVAENEKDFAFVHSSWDDGIEPWRFQIPTYTSNGAISAHSILDRTLLRAGDTVHMKFYLRKQTGTGFAQVPEKERPSVARVTHFAEGQKYNLKIKWTADGTAEAEWRIPKEAKLGEYAIRLMTDPKNDYSGWETARFRVEEFRVPLMRGTLQPPKEPLVAVSKVPLDFSVSYLSGGGASNLPVQLRAIVREESSVSFPDFEDFTFGEGVLAVGKKTTSSDETPEEEGEARQSGASTTLKTIAATLDKAGTGRESLVEVPQSKRVQQLVAELEFQDANGERQTISSVSRVFPTAWLAGVKVDSWAVSKDDLKFHVAVVDGRGNAVKDAPVEVELLERKTFSNRKRLVGGFYAYEHSEEVKAIGSFCKGTTDVKGVLHCSGKSPISGNLIVQAKIRDPQGREGGAYRDVWVAGDKDWWFQVSDHDRMDLIPEKKNYQPGETAKLQVRMPFREATALVTLEREGVIESFVKTLSGKSPVVEIPLKGNHAPNVIVSVMAVRGRVTGVKPTALVDLGRPSFKLGMAELKVGWKAHELKVKVAATREVFKVREKAPVTISVKTASGAPLPKGSEVTVAAVDEGLLELMPNRTWNLLEAMMSQRSCSVRTLTAQMYVVGKRHFGLKALPPGGGGGGGQSTRELFDTLLLWKTKVKLDAKGEAKVEIPLNDSITSFRIVAIAAGGTGLFGQGSTNIRTSQDLMLFAGIPPLVRQGDDVGSRFTLRNTTTVPMNVEVRLKVSGLKESPAPQTVVLPPGESKEVEWNVKVPSGVTSLVYEVEANDKNAGRDRLKITQKVLPAVPVRTYQATLVAVDNPQTLTVEKPPGALAGEGGIKTIFSASLVGSLAGVVDYMKAYPYTCFEQEASRAVAMDDRKAWDRLMAKLPSYQDRDGLIKFFPSLIEGSDTLTSYILSLGAEANWEIPAEPLGRARGGLQGVLAGSVDRQSPFATPDLTLRKVTALEALTRSPQEKTDPKYLGSLNVEPTLWPTSTVIEWWLVLQRMEDAPDRTKRLAEAEQVLRSRLNLRGTSLGFSTEKTDDLSWLMVSVDGNSARTLLAVLKLANWKNDVPRLAKGTIARQRQGHWDLTTANAWGALAIRKFRDEFEKAPVAGTTTAELKGAARSVDWKNKPSGDSLFFDWPAGKETLTASHAGRGAPWLTVQSLAAIPLKEKKEAGFQIEKTVKAVERKTGAQWSVGDIVRVTLKLKAQADLPWVVVDDPIPAGASLLGTGLGRDSQIATQGEKTQGAYPAFQEKAFDGLRSYYQSVPRGEWVVEYTMRLNAGGKFELPPTRVEAMYEPDVFAEAPNTVWQVAP